MEAAEVYVINALAPLTLNSKVRPPQCAPMHVCERPEHWSNVQPCPAQMRCSSFIQLKDMMMRSGEPSWIINVSSMEGRFSSFKERVHPHTNMAKAALNMMTCTSSNDYAHSKIFMSSVDTGWVTEENPNPIAKDKERSGFAPPLVSAPRQAARLVRNGTPCIPAGRD